MPCFALESDIGEDEIERSMLKTNCSAWARSNPFYGQDPEKWAPWYIQHNLLAQFVVEAASAQAIMETDTDRLSSLAEYPKPRCGAITSDMFRADKRTFFWPRNIAERCPGIRVCGAEKTTLTTETLPRWKST